MKRDYLVLILIGITILLSLLLFSKCGNYSELSNINESINDTLSIERNKLNQEIATIKVLQMQSEKDFLNLKVKDSTINWLQSTVKNYKGRLNTAIVISNTTTSKGASKTLISSKNDTIKIDSFIYIMPVYQTSWINKWEKGSIIASKDSIFRNISMRNEFEIIQGEPKNGWFKKNEYLIQVKNLNPNTYTDELRSFNVYTKPKRFNLGIQVGYGLSLINFKPIPYIGLGGQFTIIGVK